GFSEAGSEESIGSSFLYSFLPPPTPSPPSIPSPRSPQSPAPPLASSSGRDVEADDRDANAAGEPPKKRRRGGVSCTVCGLCGKDPKDDECETRMGLVRSSSLSCSPKDDSREYIGWSRTKALEDTVAHLESHLHELEHREDVMPSDMSTWNDFRDVEPSLNVWRLDYSTFSRVGYTITLHILRL
ncbi:hypothetical protein C8J57DRAFT_1385374, partial [Mycena rebaudengoi]